MNKSKLKQTIKESIQETKSWDDIFAEYYNYTNSNKSIADQSLKFIKWLVSKYKAPEKL